MPMHTQFRDWHQATYLKEALVCANHWMFFSFPLICVPVILLTDLSVLTWLVPDLALWILDPDLALPLTTFGLLPWY